MAYQTAGKFFRVCFFAAAGVLLAQNGYVIALFIACGIWKLTQKPLPYYTVLVFAGTLILRLLILWFVHPAIESDFETLFQAAHQILAGDFSYQKTAYFSLWAYQTAFVIWEALWLLLWDSPICMELVNTVLAAGTACLLYRLSRGWTGEASAQAASLLLAVFPFSLTLHTLLSNQIPSAFFLTLGLWLLLCSDCNRLGFFRFALAGIGLQFGNLLRNEGIIFLTAIFAWAVFSILKRPAKLRRLLPGIVLLTVVYFSTFAAASALVHASGLNPYGLQNGNPMWKFVTGFCYETQGGYSEQDWEAIGRTLDRNWQKTEETEVLQKELLTERLSQKPGVLLYHMRNKLRCQWIADGLSWALGHTREGHPGLYQMAQQLDRGLFFLALGLTGYGLSSFQRKPDWETEKLVPYFIFFAAFCAFLIVEVQPRYAYLPQLYLFTGAAFGMERLRKQHFLI